jgi:integrase
MDQQMGSRQLDRYIKWRNGVAQYYRRLPADIMPLYANGGSKQDIQISLKTRDPIEAERRRDEKHRQTEKLWDYFRTNGATPCAFDAYMRKAEQANELGFDYTPMEELFRGTIFELEARLNIVKRIAPAGTMAKDQIAEVVLGVGKAPPLLLSEALEKYWTFKRDFVAHKSDNQERVWRNGRKRAVKNLISVIGDVDFNEFERNDGLTYREWWLDRVMEEGLKFDTANKDIEILCEVFQTVLDKLKIKKDNLMRGLRLQGGDTENRVSLSKAETIKHLFKDNPLRGLNAEARAIVEICAETGARPIEIVNREPSDIFLDAKIPYIHIRKNKYGHLKTKVSGRKLPLVGAALTAFQAFPEGFPTYAGKPTSAANVIGKYFRENSTLPNGATLYSLRHGFQDRLTALEVPLRVEKALMGHSPGKVSYGDGPQLPQLLRWMKRVVLVK